jgi:hypothetical protein
MSVQPSCLPAAHRAVTRQPYDRLDAMNGEALSEFAKLLGNFQPGWVLAILVTTILAYRAPQILKEFSWACAAC